MRSQIAAYSVVLAMLGACASEPTPTVATTSTELVELTIVSNEGTAGRARTIEVTPPSATATRPAPTETRRSPVRIAKMPTPGLPMPPKAPETRPVEITLVLLDDLQPEASAEAQAWAKKLSAQNAAERSKAITALGALGADGALAAAPLLGNPSADVRYCALSALIAAGHGAAGMTNSIVGRLQDTDAGVRHQALRALRLLGSDASDAIAACLTDTVWTVRHEAARALGAMHLTDAAKKALDHTSRFDRDELVRRACRMALDR